MSGVEWTVTGLSEGGRDRVSFFYTHEEHSPDSNYVVGPETISDSQYNSMFSKDKILFSNGFFMPAGIVCALK
jgi:hypothetical protein